MYKSLITWKWLAIGAEMGTALSYSDTCNGCLATIAGFVLSLVDLEFVLEIATAIHPINAGTVAFDAQIQHIPNALPELGGLLGG